jgi:hypothetical protein
METIVAGRFETFEQAEAAVRDLTMEGFRREDASAFFVNPPGQHAQFPIGGDQYAECQGWRSRARCRRGCGGGRCRGVGRGNRGSRRQGCDPARCDRRWRVHRLARRDTR